MRRRLGVSSDGAALGVRRRVCKRAAVPRLKNVRRRRRKHEKTRRANPQKRRPRLRFGEPCDLFFDHRLGEDGNDFPHDALHDVAREREHRVDLRLR